MTIEKFNESNKSAKLVKMTQAIFGQSKESPGNKDPKDLVFATEVERERYVDKLQATDLGSDYNELISGLTEAKNNIRAETKKELAILKELMPKINAGKGTAADAKTWQDAENKLSDLGRNARMRQQAETFERLSKGVVSVVKPVEIPQVIEMNSLRRTTPVVSKDLEIDSFVEISKTLKSSKNVTKEVQDNALAIEAELTKASNKNAVKESIGVLVNPGKTNKDFQKSLGIKEDGIIGRLTINTLFTKAGSEYRIPEVKKSAPVQIERKKSLEEKSDVSIVSPADVIEAGKVEKQSISIQNLETKKGGVIGKSINDFNEYIKNNHYNNRIIQKSGFAKWTTID